MRRCVVAWVVCLQLVARWYRDANGQDVPADVLGQVRSDKRTALLIGNASYAGSGLTNPINDARAMTKALRALRFFAGHGVQISGEHYLVPIDAAIKREADVPVEAIPLSFVVAKLVARVNIVIHSP